jgi:hypothetical protein
VKVYGYCTRCRRVRPIRATGRAGNLITGTCSQCEQARKAVRS